jgi:hypothetical protein
MPESFSQAYARLNDYISTHPEIDIADSVISIPEQVRAGFYAEFNAARAAFVEEKFPLLLDRARLLQENYRRAEEGLADLLSWEDPPMVSPVQRFLRSFRDSMERELFDLLFDLLKGRETIASFEQKGSERVAALWPAVFRAGYEKWVVLALLKILAPEKALRVNIRPLSPGERAKSAAYAPSAEIPAPEASGSFLFSQPRNATLAVPDLVIRSAALQRFVGIRSEFNQGMYNAFSASPGREWLPVTTDLLVLLESGLTLIYLSDRAEEIALVSDVSKFCRPDMVLWCIDSQDVDPVEAYERMTTVDTRLKPLEGCFVIATEPWPKEKVVPAQGEQSLRVRVISTGYDATRLKAVVDALAGENAPAAMT